MNTYLIKSVINQVLTEVDEILIDAEVKAPEYVEKGRQIVRDLKVKASKL